MKDDRKICVGQIAGTHGVRGLVRLRSFTEVPQDITAYGPLSDENGRTFKVTIKSSANDHFIAQIDGVASKEDAETLRGTKLYVSRAALPKTGRGEFYETELVGLTAKDKSGKDFGTVMAVHNYGGGPFLEIGRTKKDSFMLPFNEACVPEVDVKVGFVLVEVPEGWLDKDEKP